MSTQGFIFDDGGRKDAGFIGAAGDCVARAIAIAAEIPYREVYAALNEAAKGERQRVKWCRRSTKSSARNGVFKSTYRKYLASRGWNFTPTMAIGSGCTVHLRAEELPPGRLIVAVSKHLCAVIDGVIHDTHDPRRASGRCVYGYFSK